LKLILGIVRNDPEKTAELRKKNKNTAERTVKPISESIIKVYTTL
jgi:hypothetical protein